MNHNARSVSGQPGQPTGPTGQPTLVPRLANPATSALVTIKEFSAIKGISYPVALRAVAAGQVPSVLIGKRRMVDVGIADKHLAEVANASISRKEA